MLRLCVSEQLCVQVKEGYITIGLISDEVRVLASLNFHQIFTFALAVSAAVEKEGPYQLQLDKSCHLNGDKSQIVIGNDSWPLSPVFFLRTLSTLIPYTLSNPAVPLHYVPLITKFVDLLVKKVEKQERDECLKSLKSGNFTEKLLHYLEQPDYALKKFLVFHYKTIAACYLIKVALAKKEICNTRIANIESATAPISATATVSEEVEDDTF